MSVRALVVDDHALVRAGLVELLNKLEGVEVVGEASNGREALEEVKACAPGLVLMDVAMGGLNGLEAAARIRRDFPTVKVLILSMYSNEEYIVQALKAGVSGYLLKDSATAELDFAIKAIGRNEVYLSPAISKRVVGDYLGKLDNRSPLEQLTGRQREILQLIAEGQSTKEIAYLLNISIKTVETHRSNLMDRLNIHDIAGLVRFAVRAGLVDANIS